LTGNVGGISTRGFEGGSSITVNNSSISNNLTDSGGGIYSFWSYVTIANSTLSGNSAGTSGGGIYAEGPLVRISNSTISGNSAGTSGGAIFNNTSGYLEIDNSTISGNSADSGGGIYNVNHVDVSNTILNAGVSGENIFNNGGIVTSYGYNLSSDDGGGFLTGPGDQINTDPLLGSLQNNGGPTFTHALLPGSPAIDAGDPNFSPPLLTISEPVLSIACSTVASISVHLKRNRHAVAPVHATAASNPATSPVAWHTKKKRTAWSR
jgi:predicted outer membrane repeat protein